MLHYAAAAVYIAHRLSLLTSGGWRDFVPCPCCKDLSCLTPLHSQLLGKIRSGFTNLERQLNRIDSELRDAEADPARNGM